MISSTSSNGSCRWAKRFGNSYYQYAYSVATDSNDNVYITGDISYKVKFGTVEHYTGTSSTSRRNMYLASFTRDGVFRIYGEGKLSKEVSLKQGESMSWPNRAPVSQQTSTRPDSIHGTITCTHSAVKRADPCRSFSGLT